MSRRIVRRAPLSERIQAYLNPGDFLLWASEELNSRDWEDFNNRWSTTIGITLNLVFIFARANSGGHDDGDDVFEDYDRSSTGWLAWFCTFIVHFLILFSVANAIYTMTRRKHYRLFESDVNTQPSTPSARRVKVDSSPMTSSPFRYISGILAPSTAESRAHPEEAEEVWEIAVWDPTPVCLRLFVLFSPGNVLIATLFLPYLPLDPRPSVTVAKTIFLCALLSIQGHFLQKLFSQQSKDSSSIQQEVGKEYDAKFVQPNAHRRPVRDVGIQFPHPTAVWNDETREWTAFPEVVSGSAYLPKQAFKTKPNPAYASHYEPKNSGQTESDGQSSRPLVTPSFRAPKSRVSSGNVPVPEYSSPLKPPTNFRPFPSPQRPQYTNTASGSGDGGSLGVYSHAASPLRKTASSNVLRQGPASDVRQREGSPLKRMSTPAGGLHQRLMNVRDDGGVRRESGRY